MTPPCRPFFVKNKGGHTELLSTEFFEINSSCQIMVNFQKRLQQFEKIGNEVRQAKMTLLAGRVLGENKVGRPPKEPVIENILDEAPRIKLVRPPAPPKVKNPPKRKQKQIKRKSKRRKLRDEKPVKRCPLFKFGFVYKKK